MKFMFKNTLVSCFILVLFVTLGCQAPKRESSIVFSRLTGSYWQIWTMDADGGTLKQITKSANDKRYPVWSNDNQKLLYRTNNNGAFIFDLQTGEEKQILPEMGIIGSISQSPVSDDLLITRFRTEIMDSSNLWLTSIDGSHRTLLTRDIGLQYDPAWSPDGKEIAYVSGHGYQTHELYIINSDGSNKRQLTNNKALELLPAFSPDSNRIAYVSDQTGDFEIWVMDVNGNNVKQLTYKEGLDTRPCWSQDGTKILFVSNRSGVLHLWIMDSDGKNPRQLTSGASCMDPDWKRLHQR
jgi:TolB protein